jgi:cytochrome c-type biogenesis protein CcmH
VSKSGARPSALGSRLVPRDVPLREASNGSVAESREPRAESSLSRRLFILRAGTLALGAVVARNVDAQAPSPTGAANVPMEQQAYRPVERPAKPGATPLLDKEARDNLERRIACQCGCTLDVYTCRTTDFTCTYSPELHREVIALWDGGKTADEIVEAFVAKYGEEALMAPEPEGFNLAGYLVPGVLVTGLGATLLWVLSRRARLSTGRIQGAGAAGFSRPDSSDSSDLSASSAVSASPAPTLTPDDLALLEQALAEDDRR